MSQQTINVGSAPNDGTGDPLRTGFQKINANFTENYASIGSIQAVIDGLGTMATQDADSVAITNGSADLSNLTCGNVTLTGGSVSDAVTGVIHPSDIGTLVLAPDGDAAALTNIPNPFDQSLNVADSPTFAAFNGVTIFCANANQFLFNRGTSSLLVGAGAAVTSLTINGVPLGTAAASAATAFQASASTLTSWAAITRASGFDTFTATPSSANLRSLLTDETGTGAAVFATSPTLVTPVLGTPTSGTLTNCTLPISGVTGLGTRIVTFLVTPSSANLASAVQDGTGSGALVLATSPALVTPDLGTPSAGILTNCTGTASGLTAGNVTTNANLTGNVTSVGNATTLVSIPAISGANLTTLNASNISSGSLAAARFPTAGITGGTIAGLTGFGIRSTGAAFDLTLASSEVFTAGRTLTLTLGDAARTLTLSGNPSLSGVTITGTGTLATGTKTLTISNTITLAGTDSTTMTFPSTSATMARTDAFQTFATRQDVTGTVRITNFVDPSSGAGMELQYDPALNKGNILCYDRSASTYKAFSFDASSELFYNSGTLRFSIATGGVAVTGFATVSTTLAVTGASTLTGAVTCAATLRLGNYVVSGLPAAATAGVGATAFVTDGSTTIILGLGVAVVGGGSNKVPVYSDGTNWIVG